MTIKEMFKKVEGFNEVAEIVNTEKAHIWFGEKICRSIVDGESFATFAEFRKYIRKYYVKEVAERIINDGEWKINSEREIIGVNGRAVTFEVYIEQA